MHAITVKLSKKFEVLSFNQKVLLCMALAISLYFFWSLGVDQTLKDLRGSSSSQAKDLKAKIEDIRAKTSDAMDLIKSNPRQGLSQQVDIAKKTSLDLDKKIHEKTITMVSAKDMNVILEKVIQQTEGLVVVKMESLERKVLVQAKKSDDQKQESVKAIDASPGDKSKNLPLGVAQKNNFNIFEHGLAIELAGGYFETLNFLKTLEKRHINVVWDEISYEVSKYPKAKINILMHTLSLDEDWIGV